jgi:hypothetical protein
LVRTTSALSISTSAAVDVFDFDAETNSFSHSDHGAALFGATVRLHHILITNAQCRSLPAQIRFRFGFVLDYGHCIVLPNAPAAIIIQSSLRNANGNWDSFRNGHGQEIRLGQVEINAGPADLEGFSWDEFMVYHFLEIFSRGPPFLRMWDRL